MKHNLEFGFEWDELHEASLRKMEEILSSSDEPVLDATNEFAPYIRELRSRPTRIPREAVRGLVGPVMAAGIEKLKNYSEYFRQEHALQRQSFRILCLSEVHDQILMWSHYGEKHTGAVLELQPIVERDTPTLVAEPVRYSDDVPVIASLEEILDWVAGKRSYPEPKELFRKQVYTKSPVWSYEKEWRIFLTKREEEEGLFSQYTFYPEELTGIYLGCRINGEIRSRIVSLAKRWPIPVNLYQMRDERLRYELTTDAVGQTNPDASA